MTRKKGGIPWNKGLTKYTDKRLMKLSESLKGKTYVELYGEEKAILQKKKLKDAHVGKTWDEMYGKKRADELREKRRERFKKNNPMNTFVAKEKIRKCNIGKKHSKETIKKLSISHLGLKTRLGCHHTEETKRKLSICKKGKTYDEMYGIEKAKEIKIKLAQHIHPFKDTSIEIRIQNFLNFLSIDFIKHKTMKINHPYACDIFVPSLNLVIECDGNYWHNYPNGKELDRLRNKELIENGFNILRLWESEIKNMNLVEFECKLEEFNENMCHKQKQGN